MLKHFKTCVIFLATGFGLGYAPKAPGTVGTLAGVLLYLAFAPFSLTVYLIATLVVCVIGVPICGLTAKWWGMHDHPSIVWDEVAGYLITMIAWPFAWSTIVIGFIWFRVFDILKPWPINLLDKRVQGGLGIMLDDILAGVYAWFGVWATLQLI